MELRCQVRPPHIYADQIPRITSYMYNINRIITPATLASHRQQLLPGHSLFRLLLYLPELLVATLRRTTTTRLLGFRRGMYATPHPRIQLLARIIKRIQLLHAPPRTEEILCAQAPHVPRYNAPRTLQRALRLLAPYILAHGPHGRVSTRLLDVAAAHARADADEIIEVEVVAVDFGVAQDEGEDVVALGGCRETDGEFLGHAT